MIVVEERYRFTIFPIQDSQTLLDRLNTRRLRSRIIWRSKKKKIKERRSNLYTIEIRTIVMITMHYQHKNNSNDITTAMNMVEQSKN